MSEENSAESQQAPEVRKKVFVIKAKFGGLKSAENFLKNRSWDIISSFDMKIALATLFRHKIDYALIGVDHAHPHVLKLPDIVAQTIKIPVILFAENMTAQAAHMLRTTRHPYVLFPPVSGPAIERMLLRIEKDRTQSVQKANDLRVSESMLNDNSAIRVSEGGGAFDNAQMNGSFSEEDIAKLFAGEGLSPLMSATENGPSSEMMNQKQAGNSADPFSENEPGFGATNSFKAREPQGASGDSLVQYQKGASAHTLMETEEEVPSVSMSEVQTETRASKGKALSPPLPKGSKIDLSLWPQGNQPTSESNGRSTEPPKNFAPAIEDAGGYDRQVRYQSVLLSGTEDALAKSSMADPNVNVPLKIAPVKSSNVGCFAVDSAGVSGVIVCAYGNDRVIDRKFANDLQDHLLLYMQKNGTDFKIDDIMNLKIHQVAFEEWSEKEALFLRKSIHAGCELALGFFINTTPQGRLEPSIHQDMLKMNIDEIRVDNSLEFDVYLYFPENQKYIRYVGKDGNLSEKQWDRLTAGGVTELHVKKDAESDISKYRMKNFLNDKIADFNGKKTA